jgi:hypothetical protein
LEIEDEGKEAPKSKAATKKAQKISTLTPTLKNTVREVSLTVLSSMKQLHVLADLEHLANVVDLFRNARKDVSNKPAKPPVDEGFSDLDKRIKWCFRERCFQIFYTNEEG